MRPSLIPEACGSRAHANSHQLSRALSGQKNVVSFTNPTGTNYNLRPGTGGHVNPLSGARARGYRRRMSMLPIFLQYFSTHSHYRTSFSEVRRRMSTLGSDVVWLMPLPRGTSLRGSQTPTGTNNKILPGDGGHVDQLSDASTLKTHRHSPN
jgi:hypothetical protein